MMNVAVQQGSPSNQLNESRMNAQLHYRRSSSSVASKNQQNACKEVYQTVVLPTVFPGHQQPWDPKNNNEYAKSCASPYQLSSMPAVNGTVYQQWSTGPNMGYSFMQQQLHQFRQQQQQRANDRSYASRGFMPNTDHGNQIVMRSPSMQPQRTASTRNFDQQNFAPAAMACNQPLTASPSPKRSSRRHHHGHHHLGQTSGGAYDLLESDALQKRHRFPTNFCRILRECPPPVPPVLLRTMPGSSVSKTTALPRYKDPANRLKVTIRVLSSASAAGDCGGSGSPEASFLVVDSRKKQLTLMEQAQQNQQRQSQSTNSQNGASGAMVPKIFGFDAVFSPDDSQTEISSTTLTDLVQTVCNDGDACLLLFGSSDQGKQQTAIGNDINAQTLGILPCAVSWLYRVISEIRQRTGARFSIRVSAVEVAGPQEDLRDLLADLAGVAVNADPSNSYEACLREDPVFGTQLHNVCELRAPTADKAAFYLDAALAKRRSASEEERRNSHLFFTLHIYQYRVNEKDSSADAAGVAGGRTRLHLIDLGAGEKNSRSGRASLTLPALGNVLLTLLQGQKHLPFKESKVTQILKSCIGSASCKAVSVVACASSDPERKMETVNVVQIAGRLYRIRRTKRGSAKFGFGAAGSSGGESSDDRSAGHRRRFPRSASDPDCTTSSSEQSCDTVIYLGAGGAKSKTGTAVGGVPSSVAISDQDIPPALEQTVSQSPLKIAKTYNDSPKRVQIPKPTNGTKQTAYVQPAVSNPKSHEQWIDGPKASKQPKLVLTMETTPDTGHSKLSAQNMDPFKREMIRQWVVHQEQERVSGSNEIWIDRPPSKPTPELVHVGNFDGTGARPKQFLATFGRQLPTAIQETPDDKCSVSMETSSSARSTSSCSDANSDSREIGLQCCEEEIDIECGRYNIPLSLLNDTDMTIMNAEQNNPYQYSHNNNTVNQEYASVAAWTEPEMRMLEDIAEVEEDENTISTLSDGALIMASRHSSRAQILVTSGTPPYRNEGMAPRPSTADGGISVLLTAPSTSSIQSLTHGTAEFEDEHPLRILSKEKMGRGSRSDTFSLDNDDATDAFSLPTSDVFMYLGAAAAGGNIHRFKLSADEDSNSSLTDEDLERAMQASLTSIRSHEILEKLKSEGKLRRNDENSIKNMDDDESDYMSSRKSSLAHLARPEPDGLDDENDIPVEKSIKSEQKPNIRLIESKPQQSMITDKVTKPTVPPLSKPMANLVTSQLINALSNAKKDEKSKMVQKQLTPFNAKSNAPQPITAEEERMSPSPHSSLPRPTKLPSPKCVEKIASPQPKIIVKQKMQKSEKEKSKPNSSNAKPTQNGQTKSVNPVAPVSTPPQVQPMANEKPKSKPTSTNSVLKSPIMSFLKSPSKFRKSTQNASNPSPAKTNAGTITPVSTGTPNGTSTLAPPPATPSSKRASSGYDSGHDSGIVTVDSPDLLLASPYSKLTKPRASQRSSSGHGSDNSSAVSSDTGGGKLIKPMTKLASPMCRGKSAKKSSTLDRDTHGGCASSSGYESGQKGNTEEMMTITTMSPESDAESNSWSTAMAQDRLKSPPSVKLHRKKWLDGFGFDASKSRSAPQSPNGTVISPQSSRPQCRILQSQYAAETSLDSQWTLKGVDLKQQHMAAVEHLKIRQRELKCELKQAKERLGVPPSKWSYDLHVADCMDVTNLNMLDALRQETKILEKRVAACKSHVLMVTVFDAVPVSNTNVDAARKCS